MKTPNSSALIEGADRPLLVTWDERNAGPSWDDKELGWRAKPPFEKLNWEGSAIGPIISGVNFRFFPYRLPHGQSRPFHTADNLELLFFILEGDIEFEVGPNIDELELFRVKKFDTLFVPLGMGVGYRNVGKTEAQYVMTVARVGEWPKEVVYHLPDEKEPYIRTL